MAEETGFTTMAGKAATGEAPTLGIGMLGYAFMGKAHSNAFRKIQYMTWPPPLLPKLVAIAGRVRYPETKRAAKPSWRSACTSSQALSRHEPLARRSVSSALCTPASMRVL